MFPKKRPCYGEEMPAYDLLESLITIHIQRRKVELSFAAKIHISAIKQALRGQES